MSDSEVLPPIEKKTVAEWLASTDYNFEGYVPSLEACIFTQFIKQVNGGAEENKTPIVHCKMMDNVFNKYKRCALLCHRGIGKTAVFAEYKILYMAAYGEFLGFGKVNLVLYVTDSIENGVKNLRKNVEHRYFESKFLQELIPNRNIVLGYSDIDANGNESRGTVNCDNFDTAEKLVTTADPSAGRKFTDVRLEFRNIHGHKLVVKGYGAKTGVRGAKEMGIRPQVAILDDLFKDTDANSPTVRQNIKDTVHKAVANALHPKRRKMIWLGTPFNQSDPLYEAVEGGAWKTSVYPIAEKFPCSEEEFRGSWPDRFDYQFCKDEYENAIANNEPQGFFQELMLQISSDDERIIRDEDIQWYDRNLLMARQSDYNFYITTDFATSEKQSADFSVISVWALDSRGSWFWVDGVCRRQLMDANMDDLFRLAQMYRPQRVGVEVSGQQGGFIQWIQQECMTRNVRFRLASDNNSGRPGIRPNKDKLARFMTTIPLFKDQKINFPTQYKETNELKEAINELSLASRHGFRSKHDDFIDTISMLTVLDTIRPSTETTDYKGDFCIESPWDDPRDSYIV